MKVIPIQAIQFHILLRNGPSRNPLVHIKVLQSCLPHPDVVYRPFCNNAKFCVHHRGTDDHLAVLKGWDERPDPIPSKVPKGYLRAFSHSCNGSGR